MAKYLIYWDAGYGKTTDVVEAENEDKASEEASTGDVGAVTPSPAKPYTDRALLDQVRDALMVATTPLAEDRQTVLKAVALIDAKLSGGVL